MALSQLPDELLLCIAHYLQRDGDISALARSNRKLYHCLVHYIYRHNLEEYKGDGLRRAVSCGSEASVQKFLDAGANIVDYHEKHEFELLWTALKEQHTKVVDVLLAAPIKKESQVQRAECALRYAATFLNETTVKFLVSTDFKLQLGTDFSYSRWVIFSAVSSVGRGDSRGVTLYGELGDHEVMVEEIFDRSIRSRRSYHEDDKIVKPIQNGTEVEAIVMMLLRQAPGEIFELSHDAEGCLSRYAQQGFAEVVAWLLDKERALFSSIKLYNEPLKDAASGGNLAVVKILLDSGLFPRQPEWEPPEDYNDNPVLEAAQSGNADVVKLLLDYYSGGEEVRESDIHAAAENARSSEVLRLLAKEGLNLDAEYASALLHRAAHHGRSEVVKFLLGETSADPEQRYIYPKWRSLDLEPEYQDRDVTALACAAVFGRADTVKLLLQHTDPNSRCQHGLTALSLAATSKRAQTDDLIDTIDVLLADPRVDPESRDDDGRTALSLAADVPPRWRVARHLLKDCRIDPNSRDNDGRTPLSWATHRGTDRESSPIYKYLLSDPRVDPDSPDNSSRTPLSWAAQESPDSYFVRALLENPRVDPDSRDNHGRTPLSFAAEWCKEHSRYEPAEMLLLADPRVDPDSQDEDGRTPLSWFAEHGLEAAFEQALQRRRAGTLQDANESIELDGSSELGDSRESVEATSV